MPVSHAALEDMSSDLLDTLQRRANNLLAELRAYQACLQAHSKQKEVEIRTFKRGIESEVKTLNAVSKLGVGVSARDLTDFEADELESKRLHALRSSNLPFYEAVWSTARRCSGVVALGKRVYWKDKLQSGGTANHSNLPIADQPATEKKSAVVDIIAQDGLEWIKVSTVTGKRLLYEMAKEGWESYGDRSDSEDLNTNEESGVNSDKQGGSAQLELVKLARVLYAASRADRVRFRHPTVQFVLPKIHEGVFDDVDAVIADIRSSGVKVICGDGGFNIVDSISTLNLSNQFEQRDFTRLLPSGSIFSPLPTPTLNIDCTILLALISDISHIPSKNLPLHPNNISGHYHKAITKQISQETTTPLLSDGLYPLFSGRLLVCTSLAAQRMREIVQTMGTATEAARAEIILAEDSFLDHSPDSLRIALGRVSCHTVPSSVQLPIRTVNFEYDADGDNRLALADKRIMHKLTKTMKLSSINSSVFLYGWQEGLMTVTSNRSVATGLVRHINDILDEEERAEQGYGGGGGGGKGEEEEEFSGPSIYVCETARSLIGKEKQ